MIAGLGYDLGCEVQANEASTGLHWSAATACPGCDSVSANFIDTAQPMSCTTNIARTPVLSCQWSGSSTMSCEIPQPPLEFSDRNCNLKIHDIRWWEEHLTRWQWRARRMRAGGKLRAPAGQLPCSWRPGATAPALHGGTRTPSAMATCH